MTPSRLVPRLRRAPRLAPAALLALALTAPACGGSEPSAALPAAPPPAAPPVPSASAAAAPAHAEQDATVIHEAHVYGKIKARAGKRVLVEPLVLTSHTPPTKGNKGGIYRVVEEGDGAELLHLAEVVIAETMQEGKSIAVDIVDEKKDVLLEGKKVNHFVPGTKVRLQYEW